jgi:hypothetical protein
MKKKRGNIFLVVFFLFFLFLFVSFSSGQEQPKEGAKIGIINIRTFSGPLIITGVVLCVLAIVWGAIHLFLSFGDPSRISEGKEWVIGGFTGLFLILSAGALYHNITGVSNTTAKEDSNQIGIFEIHLPQKAGVSPESSAGVYLCFEICDKIKIGETKDPKTGKVEEVFRPDPRCCLGPLTAPEPSVPVNVKEIYIYNFAPIDSELSPKSEIFPNGTNFGCIIFNRPDFESKFKSRLPLSSIIHFPQNLEYKFVPSFKVASIAVFNLPFPQESYSAGEGVEFYQDTHFRGGVYHLKDEDIHPAADIYSNWYDLSNMKIDYTGTDVSAEVQERCKFFYQQSLSGGYSCLKSIKILGNYGVLLEETLTTPTPEGEYGTASYALIYSYEGVRNIGLLSAASPQTVMVFPYKVSF